MEFRGLGAPLGAVSSSEFQEMRTLNLKSGHECDSITQLNLATWLEIFYYGRDRIFSLTITSDSFGLPSHFSLGNSDSLQVVNPEGGEQDTEVEAEQGRFKKEVRLQSKDFNV